RALLVVGCECSHLIFDRVLQTRSACAPCFFPRQRVQTPRWSASPSPHVPRRRCPCVPERVLRVRPADVPVSPLCPPGGLLGPEERDQVHADPRAVSKVRDRRLHSPECDVPRSQARVHTAPKCSSPGCAAEEAVSSLIPASQLPECVHARFDFVLLRSF